MDRSSFSFKGSTNDLEKRQAFKAKLANQIEPPKPKEVSPADNTFNGVSPGEKLVHPSLGEGTLVEVNHGINEVLIDFGDKGLIGLVLSQAKSFVHSPVKEIGKGIAGVDDAFLGGQILRDKPERPDTVYREVDPSRVISSDFIFPEKAPIPVGASVWHSDLGACSVFSVDEKNNTIVLNVPSVGHVDMVLSQVRSKLIPVDGSPEHVPMKPLIREPLAKRMPTYQSHGDVSVSLPEVFKIWKQDQQFMFLTRNQKLSTEQANDVFSVLSDKKPLFHSVTIAWESQEETESKVIPGPASAVELAQQIHSFSQWGNKRFWHPDFGECSVSSVDTKGNELVLNTSVGLRPFVLSTILPKLAVMLSTDTVEHAPKQLGTRVLSTRENVAVESQLVRVFLPEVFVGWKTIEQYQYLTITCKVSPDQANDIIDSLSGKLHNSKNEYTIEWTKDLPESLKRREFKQQLSGRVEQAIIEPVASPAPVAKDPGMKRVVEEVEVVQKKVILRQVSVELPSDFNSWTASGQYVFLSRTRQLTSNEANDIIDILQGRQPHNKDVEYNIIWSA